MTTAHPPPVIVPQAEEGAEFAGTSLVRRRRREAPAVLIEQAGELRALMESVLVEGVDYGTTKGVDRPFLWQAGAQWLLRWARLGHRLELLETVAGPDGKPWGARYSCAVYPLERPDMIVATHDGWAGRDERGKENAPWNTILQVAQKRAMVAATKAAVAAGGLFADPEYFEGQDK